MVYKTREKLIEVARQLFVHKGVENTTMNDIASASEKGRRTIYTYFKNKKELYDAIIESDSDKMVEDLRAIVKSDLSPVDKLRNFLQLRLDQGITLGSSTFTIKSLITFDRRRTERIRQLVSDKQSAMFKAIIDEGIDTGVFLPARCNLVLGFLSHVIQAIDTSEIDPERRDEYKTSTDTLVEFIVTDLSQHKSNN